MGYARHIGRVGALAVALGIGAAIATTPGMAWADGPDESQAAADGGSVGGEGDARDTSNASPEKHDPGEAIRRNLERATDVLRDGIRQAAPGVVRSSGGAITSTHRSGSNANSGNGSPPRVEEKKAKIDALEPPKNQPQTNSVNEAPRVFTPHWEAPQVRVSTKPAPRPVADALDDVKLTVRQTVNAVSVNQAGSDSSTADRSPDWTFHTPSTNQQPVRAPYVAPVKLVTNVLNAAIAPFLNPTPGQPAPQNPILWGVLAWVRRQVQDSPFGKFVLNQAPQITTPSVVDNHDGTFTITPSSDDLDPDGDALTYTATDGADGTVVKNNDGTFTYTVTDPGGWDKTDTVTLTASDEGAYPHIHGLVGLFNPDRGHTDSVAVTIVPDDGTLPPPPDVVKYPEERDDGSGLFDTELQYNPDTTSNVSVAQGFQPRYWTVVSESYDAETGKYTAVLKPTLAGQLRAGQGMDTTDQLKLNVTGQSQNIQSFALKSTGGAVQLATLADDGPDQALTLPTPPAATLHVDNPDVDTDSSPLGVAVTDKYAYVISANYPGKVVVIDANPADDDPSNPTYNTIVKTIAVDGYTAYGTMAGDNLYVVDINGRVSVIDTNSADDDPSHATVNTVIAQIDVPSGSQRPVATPDGKRVYVTNGFNGDLTVIDSDPNSQEYNKVVGSVTGVLPPQAEPNSDNNYTTEGYFLLSNLAFNGDGTRLYVPRIHNTLVYNVDENGNTTDVASNTYDGDIIVVDTDPSSQTYNTVLDLDTSTPGMDTIALNNGQVPDSVSSIGNRLYVSTLDYQSLIDAYGQGGDPVTAVQVVDIDPASPTYNQVIDANPASPGIDGLPVGKLPYNVATSPDRSVAYILNVLDGTVSVIDTATNEQIGSPLVYDSTPQILGQGTVRENILAISPDGKHLYITKLVDGSAAAISIV